jgi:tyrosine-specific transport protein
MGQARLWRAIATLIGTTIGAGIFGLPFAVSHVGWGIGSLMLIGLGWVTLILNLAFGEVILRTKGDHQLSGYGRIYFGRGGEILGFIAVAIGAYGAMLAYTSQIGNFLAILLPGGSPIFYSFLFLVVAGIAVGYGLKAVSEVEFFSTILILLLVFVVAVKGWTVITHHHLEIMVENPDWLTPYGVIMFALAGSAVVPEIEEILRDEHQKLWLALFWGTLIPLVVYLLFTTVVIGASGPGVSPDAISGLAKTLPHWIVSLGAIFGTLTMGTSFTSLGYVLRELYFRDLGVSRSVALFLVLAPITILFFLGARGFIPLLEITGILMGGLTGGLILALFLKARRVGSETPPYMLPLPEWTVMVLLMIFVCGVVARLLTF